MVNEELLKKYVELGLFEEDDSKPIVVGTENGLFVQGQKGKVLTTITCMLKDMYDDGEITKEEIKRIAELSTLNLDNIDAITNLLKEIKESLGE